MAVYREGFKAVEAIQKASIRIYNDACDFGALSNKGDEIWNQALCINEMYSKKGTYKFDRYSTGQSCSVEFTLIDEWSVCDERKSIKEATEKYELHYVGVKKGIKQLHSGKKYDGYFTIIKK